MNMQVFAYIVVPGLLIGLAFGGAKLVDYLLSRPDAARKALSARHHHAT